MHSVSIHQRFTDKNTVDNFKKTEFFKAKVYFKIMVFTLFRNF